MSETIQLYPITVSYRGAKTITELIGHHVYAWHDPDITDHRFPNNQDQTVQVLVKMADHVSRETLEATLDKIAKRGLRAVNVPELLALGQQFPDLRRGMPVIALGQL